MILYLARNNEPDDNCEYVSLDEDRSDDLYWRGFTFDNHPMAWSKKEFRIVPIPDWAK